MISLRIVRKKQCPHQKLLKIKKIEEVYLCQEN